MSKKIIVFIGEGGSEPCFIKKYLERKYDFINSSLTKHQEILESENIYVLISHPTFRGGIYGCGNGGDGPLLDKKTYIKIDGIIKQNFGHLIDDYSIIYLILTDINKKKEKEYFIKQNLNIFCPKGQICLNFASMEIESWFLHGLGVDFKGKYKIDEKLLQNFLKKDIEKMQNIKEMLDDVLKPSGISGLRNEIGLEFGKYIDDNKAASLNKSFNIFITSINKLLK